MDEKEVLTRFKNGDLDRAQAVALLTGATGADGTNTAQPAPVVLQLPDIWPELAVVEGPVAGHAVDPAPAEPVAVVGMAGRYPGAPDLAAFWEQVHAGHGSASAPPPGRPGDEIGHYLERVQDFDPEFFGIDAREAALMDPQERLFLETAWEALEDAGCTGGRLDALTAADGTPRSVGVFTGAGSGDYALLAARTWTSERPRPMPRGDRWSLPNRFSSLLGLTGPSQSVDTEQSSVLVALHLALAALHRGECAAAVVGGVQLLLHPAGRRPGAGEGVGALVLKPLARALADGDSVHCLVRGSAVGHIAPDSAAPGPGRRFRTTTADPAHATEQRVPQAALRAAGLDASAAVVREDAGSVRALVGEAGAATGAASLTRAVLQLRHRVLAPGPRRAGAENWERKGTAPRRIGVGVRGAGGADAHVILEEYRPAGTDTAAGTDASAGVDRDSGTATDADRGTGTSAAAGAESGSKTAGAGAGELFVLSAPTPAHLAATAQRFAELLGGPGPVPPLGALARSLRTGRSAMDCRFAAVVGDTGELVRVLEGFVREGAPCSDLRDGGADSLGLAGAPETDGYLAALWRAGRLHQLRGLWLSGIDVDWAGLERTHGAGAVVVPLPASAFLRVPLWLGGEEGPA